MASQIKTLQEILTDGEKPISPEWNLFAIHSDDCQSYIALNEKTRETLIVDPKREDLEAYRSVLTKIKDPRILCIVDTHTHADHISIAAQLAEELNVPLVMHEKSPTQRAHLRISRSTTLPAQAGAMTFLTTPGHTPDSLTVLWGPFLFGGDTVLYGDVGRDDLPGGDPEAHYKSLQLVKTHATPEMIVLPGHDFKGGRASSWKTQLSINSSLTQGHQDFVREASEFNAPAPKLLKESLKENFK